MAAASMRKVAHPLPPLAWDVHWPFLPLIMSHISGLAGLTSASFCPFCPSCPHSLATPLVVLSPPPLPPSQDSLANNTSAQQHERGNAQPPTVLAARKPINKGREGTRMRVWWLVCAGRLMEMLARGRRVGVMRVDAM